MRKKTRGVVVAGHEQTAQAGIDILKMGGNAFDAAIACMLASFVAEPCMSSAGGGAFMTAYTSDHQAMVLDFFCQSPGSKRKAENIEFFPVYVNFGKVREEFYIGFGSVAVPGTIAGIFAIHKQLASMPFKELVAPAISLARNGLPVDDFQFYDFELLDPINKLHPESRSIYYPNGRLIKEGEIFTMPHFADFLETLCIEGPDLFYKGDVSRLIEKVSKEKGGHLRRQDLIDYEVQFKQPLSLEYNNYKILTNPFPSTGGSMVALSLAIINHKQKYPAAFSIPYIMELQHTLMEVQKIRSNPESLKQFTPGLLQQMDGQSIFDHHLLTPTKKWGSTTHFSIVDEFGNAASISSTNGEGSGCVVPGTHIMLNNMLGEAALFPMGFHSWEPNTRISSLMAPTIALNSRKEVAIALGSGGAGRIPSAILQVLHFIIDYQMNVKDAVRSPRLHWQNNQFNIEGGFAPDLILPLPKEMQVRWSARNMFFGGVHAITVNRGIMEGEGDARRSGVVKFT